MAHNTHVHFIVPGGGLSPDRLPPRVFLPVKVLSRLFRRLYLEGLARLHRSGKLAFFGDLARLSEPDTFATLLAPLRKIDWIVHVKPLFGGPKQYWPI